MGKMSQISLQLSSRLIAEGLDRPLFATAAPGDQNRLFIVEQKTAKIKILDLNTKTLLPLPFLTINPSEVLTTGGEQGLLGLAFHPDFANNSKFYISYTAPGGGTAGNTSLIEYQLSTNNPNIADPTTARKILSINQPQSNHNGGWIAFGPDGYLYWGVGDGGGSDDNDSNHTPGVGNAQDITDNLLGKILRLDVNGDDFPNDSERNYAIVPDNPFVGKEGDDEIWAFGLRNPWRASFDRTTGDLYIADVGQNNREEINFQPASSLGGENYGWRLREGTIPTPTGGVGGVRPLGAIDPFYDYDNSIGRSVTGGYVYRGIIEALDGTYFFADFVSSKIWSLRFDGTTISEKSDRTLELKPDVGSIDRIASFGEDAMGNLYIIDLDGEIFQIQEKKKTINFSDFSDISNLSLNGDTIQVDNFLRLVPSAVSTGSNFSTGSVFLTNPISIDTDTSFNTQFEVQITNVNGGGDGFVFMLHNDAEMNRALGGTGNNLGYSGIAPSVAIQFDTFQNTVDFDPDNNHVGLNLDGSNISEVTATPEFDLSSSSPVNVWIDYDGRNNLLTVFLSLTSIKPVNPLLSTNVDLSNLGRQAFVGFSGAASSGNAANIDILKWIYRIVEQWLSGDNGPNLLFGNQGNDNLDGKNGNDTLYGGKHEDRINGDRGDDWLNGNKGNDTLNGGLDNDTLYGGKNNDLLNGGNDRDWLSGNRGNDTLTGGESDDTLYGGQDNDLLNGNEGNDLIFGNKGNDVLNGDIGLDTLSGGDGSDIFIFSSFAEGLDTIADFDRNQDEIQLIAAGFSQELGSNQLLDPSQFIIGSSATNATQRIIYNQATGLLFFDSDGNGESKAIAFAELNQGIALSSEDIWII